MPVFKTGPSAHIWMGAEQFFNAAEVLFLTENLNDYIYPLLVNYALSVELALKSTVGKVKISNPASGRLIPAAQIKSSVWGHDLSGLFSELPPDIQVAIAQEFKLLTGEEIFLLMEVCKDYFVMGRYAHEHIGGSYDLSGIRTLAQGVLKATRVVGLDIENSGRNFF